MAFARYQWSEVRAFAHNRLRIIGDPKPSLRRAFTNQFAFTIARLPPWQQAIMIEGGGDNVTGTADAINECFDEDDRVIGFFMPGKEDYTVSAKEHFSAVNAIFWAGDAADKPSTIINHEQGHRIDAFMAQRFLSPDAGPYYSARNAKWKEGLIQENVTRGVVSVETKKLAAKSRSKFFREVAADIDETVPLYPDYRPLLEHLATYKKAEHASEAFAEMNTHYCELYARLRGYEPGIGEKIEKHLPYLWHAYQAKIRPLSLQMAREMQLTNMPLIRAW